jgi:hypothetical protein
MLYHVDHFGGETSFERLWTKGAILPNIQWEKYIPEELMQPWRKILDWKIAESHFPTPEVDAAAAEMADYFAEQGHSVPFRPPSLQEKQRESELGNFYAGLTTAAGLLTEARYTDLIGNFFKPSSLRAALGFGQEVNINTWLSGQTAGLVEPKPVRPFQLKELFDELKSQVTAASGEHCTGLKLTPERTAKVLTAIETTHKEVKWPVDHTVRWDDAYIDNVVASPNVPPKTHPLRPLPSAQIGTLMMPARRPPREDSTIVEHWEGRGDFPLLTNLMRRSQNRATQFSGEEWIALFGAISTDPATFSDLRVLQDWVLARFPGEVTLFFGHVGHRRNENALYCAKTGGSKCIITLFGAAKCTALSISTAGMEELPARVRAELDSALSPQVITEPPLIDVLPGLKAFDLTCSMAIRESPHGGCWIEQPGHLRKHVPTSLHWTAAVVAMGLVNLVVNCVHRMDLLAALPDWPHDSASPGLPDIDRLLAFCRDIARIVLEGKPRVLHMGICTALDIGFPPKRSLPEGPLTSLADTGTIRTLSIRNVPPLPTPGHLLFLPFTRHSVPANAAIVTPCPNG